MSVEGNTSLPEESAVQNRFHHCNKSKQCDINNPIDLSLDDSLDKSQTVHQPDLPNIDNLSIESATKESSATNTVNGTLESPQPTVDNHLPQETEQNSSSSHDKSSGVNYQQIVERIHDLGNEVSPQETEQTNSSNNHDKSSGLNYQQIVERLHDLGNEVSPQETEQTNSSSSHDKSSGLNYQQIVERLHDLGNEVNEEAPLLPTNRGMTNGMIPTPPSSPCLKDKSEEAERVLEDEHGINYCRYQSEHQMPDIMSLISRDLSEPYSIYTYRYFIHNWPNLCFLAIDGEVIVGAVVCKLDPHKRTMKKRGYLAMLAVDNTYRRKKIGSKLVSIAINAMIEQKADEIVLETEVTNGSALRLYEQLGFVRDKRLHKYYLNGVDAFRLKLWLT